MFRITLFANARTANALDNALMAARMHQLRTRVGTRQDHYAHMGAVACGCTR